jgi:hypothetical protein
LKHRKWDTLPLELTSSELAFVTGGQAISFVNQLNDTRVAIGNHATVVAAFSFVADVVADLPVTRPGRKVE